MISISNHYINLRVHHQKRLALVIFNKGNQIDWLGRSPVCHHPLAPDVPKSQTSKVPFINSCLIQLVCLPFSSWTSHHNKHGLKRPRYHSSTHTKVSWLVVSNAQRSNQHDPADSYCESPRTLGDRPGGKVACCLIGILIFHGLL